MNRKLEVDCLGVVLNKMREDQSTVQTEGCVLIVNSSRMHLRTGKLTSELRVLLETIVIERVSTKAIEKIEGDEMTKTTIKQNHSTRSIKHL